MRTLKDPEILRGSVLQRCASCNDIAIIAKLPKDMFKVSVIPTWGWMIFASMGTLIVCKLADLIK